MKERQFWIRFRDDDGIIKNILVNGEFAFEYKSFRFFVRRSSDCWIVSDCLCGAAISRNSDKQKAIYEAAGKILLRFDDYMMKCKRSKLGKSLEYGTKIA